MLSVIRLILNQCWVCRTDWEIYIFYTSVQCNNDTQNGKQQRFTNAYNVVKHQFQDLLVQNSKVQNLGVAVFQKLVRQIPTTLTQTRHNNRPIFNQRPRQGRFVNIYLGTFSSLLSWLMLVHFKTHSTLIQYCSTFGFIVLTDIFLSYHQFCLTL